MTNTRKSTASRLVAMLALTAVLIAGLFGMGSAVSNALADHTVAVPMTLPLVQVDVSDVAPAVLDALYADGYVGTAGDGCECLYVTVNTTIDVPGGIWTVTPDGLAYCEDGASGECDGTEWLTTYVPTATAV